MDRLAVENMRNWGEVWLGTVLWGRLGLDGFWASRLPPSRKGTDWLAVMKAIVMYRLTDPGSELDMHTNWLANTAVAELIGAGALTGLSTLYSCLDRVMWPTGEWRKPRGERNPALSFKDGLFLFLRDRWAGLFGSTCDVVLFDLTSTYFEVDGTKALGSDLQRYGYSRDKRGDCLQVVIALVLTPDGFPLAYEVMPGNTSDRGTQMPFIRKLEAKYGKIGNLWLMDRGVPSENTLAEMRKDGYRYLVGAPRGHLKVIGKKLDEAPWEQVQDGISVKVAKAADGTGDTFVLTKSTARSLKETAMRVKKIRSAMKTLRAMDERLGRSKWRRIKPSKRGLGRDELIARLAVAETKAGRVWKMIDVTIPKEGDKVTAESFSWKLDWQQIREARANDEGTYLLRTNLPECDPRTLWRKYMIQGEIEHAFRELKNDLGLRPVYHQLEDRIEAHIFTAFMALCLLQTLRAIAREHAPGLTPRQIIEKFRTVKMVDVVMPTTDGRIVTLPRYVEPKKDVAILLDRLGLTLPAQPPPKVSSRLADAAKT
jgi:transposase